MPRRSEMDNANRPQGPRYISSTAVAIRKPCGVPSGHGALRNNPHALINAVAGQVKLNPFSGCRLNDFADGGPTRGAVLEANVDNHRSPSVSERLTLAFRCALNREIGELNRGITLN